MKTWLLIVAGAVGVLSLTAAKDRETSSVAAAEPTTAPTTESVVRFEAVYVWIDPRGQALAAYQFELSAPGASVTLVGVEGGEHPAYAEPPYYDPHAQVANRIVIAGFSTSPDLPRQKTRVATVMLRVTGDGPVNYQAKLHVAASPDAKPIDAAVGTEVASAPRPTGAEHARAFVESPAGAVTANAHQPRE